MVTHIFFDLCLFKHFSPVANFGYQSLVGVDIAPLSKQMAVKKFYWLPGRFEQNLFITCRNRHIKEKKMGPK